MHTKHPLLAPKAPKRMAHNDTIAKESTRRVVGFLDKKHGIVWVTSRKRMKEQIKRPMSKYANQQFYDVFKKW